MSSTVRDPITSFVFSGSTKAAVRFGVGNRWYARNRRTGKWTYAYSIGMWFPVTESLLEHQADELEPRYRKWLRTCPKAELDAAKIPSRR
jgi:hypothetical protein